MPLRRPALESPQSDTASNDQLEVEELLRSEVRPVRHHRGSASGAVPTNHRPVLDSSGGQAIVAPSTGPEDATIEPGEGLYLELVTLL